MKIEIDVPENWLLAVATMQRCLDGDCVVGKTGRAVQTNGGCCCEDRFADAFGTDRRQARVVMSVFRSIRRKVEQETEPEAAP